MVRQSFALGSKSCHGNFSVPSPGAALSTAGAELTRCGFAGTGCLGGSAAKAWALASTSADCSAGGMLEIDFFGDFADLVIGFSVVEFQDTTPVVEGVFVDFTIVCPSF